MSNITELSDDELLAMSGQHDQAEAQVEESAPDIQNIPDQELETMVQGDLEQDAMVEKGREASIVETLGMSFGDGVFGGGIDELAKIAETKRALEGGADLESAMKSGDELGENIEKAINLAKSHNPKTALAGEVLGGTIGGLMLPIKKAADFSIAAFEEWASAPEFNYMEPKAWGRLMTAGAIGMVPGTLIESFSKFRKIPAKRAKEILEAGMSEASARTKAFGYSDKTVKKLFKDLDQLKRTPEEFFKDVQFDVRGNPLLEAKQSFDVTKTKVLESIKSHSDIMTMSAKNADEIFGRSGVPVQVNLNFLHRMSDTVAENAALSGGADAFTKKISKQIEFNILNPPSSVADLVARKLHWSKESSRLRKLNVDDNVADAMKSYYNKAVDEAFASAQRINPNSKVADMYQSAKQSWSSFKLVSNQLSDAAAGEFGALSEKAGFGEVIVDSVTDGVKAGLLTRGGVTRLLSIIPKTMEQVALNKKSSPEVIKKALKLQKAAIAAASGEAGVLTPFFTSLAKSIARNEDDTILDTTINALSSAIDLVESPVERTSASFLKNAEKIMDLANASNQPQTARMIRGAIESNNLEGIAKVANMVSKNPASALYVKPGLGWDGKLTDQQDYDDARVQVRDAVAKKQMKPHSALIEMKRINEGLVPVIQPTPPQVKNAPQRMPRGNDGSKLNGF